MYVFLSDCSSARCPKVEHASEVTIRPLRSHGLPPLLLTPATTALSLIVIYHSNAAVVFVYLEADPWAKGGFVQRAT